MQEHLLDRAPDVTDLEQISRQPLTALEGELRIVDLLRDRHSLRAQLEPVLHVGWAPGREPPGGQRIADDRLIARLPGERERLAAER